LAWPCAGERQKVSEISRVQQRPADIVVTVTGERAEECLVGVDVFNAGVKAVMLKLFEDLLGIRIRSQWILFGHNDRGGVEAISNERVLRFGDGVVGVGRHL